jgi:CheY-like chemotaxis protein
LAQVFSNLLNNAAKYTEPDGRIWLTASEADGRIVVSVRDSGLGIAPEMLPRIFNLFAQGDGALARAQGGLGIGLALARHLVEMHGGRIEARSAGIGRGSEFRVSLPLAAEPKRVDTVANAPTQPPAPQPSSLRVMVVDDNRDAGDSLGMLLRLRGMEAQVLHDGPSALRAMSTFRPEVVLLDLGMPDMDGYQVAQHIREDPGFDRVTLVALTGWGHDDFRRRSKEIGFDHHLVKPVDVESLIRLLGSKNQIGSAS